MSLWELSLGGQEVQGLISKVVFEYFEEKQALQALVISPVIDIHESNPLRTLEEQY